jgi:hypothetical protein
MRDGKEGVRWASLVPGNFWTVGLRCLHEGDPPVGENRLTACTGMSKRCILTEYHKTFN